MEIGSVRAIKGCPAQTLYLKSLCVLKNTMEWNCFHPEEATVKGDFEEKTGK